MEKYLPDMDEDSEERKQRIHDHIGLIQMAFIGLRMCNRIQINHWKGNTAVQESVSSAVRVLLQCFFELSFGMLFWKPIEIDNAFEASGPNNYSPGHVAKSDPVRFFANFLHMFPVNLLKSTKWIRSLAIASKHRACVQTSLLLALSGYRILSKHSKTISCFFNNAIEFEFTLENGAIFFNGVSLKSGLCGV